MTAVEVVVTLAAALAVGWLFIRGPFETRKKD